MEGYRRPYDTLVVTNTNYGTRREDIKHSRPQPNMINDTTTLDGAERSSASTTANRRPTVLFSLSARSTDIERRTRSKHSCIQNDMGGLYCQDSFIVSGQEHCPATTVLSAPTGREENSAMTERSVQVQAMPFTVTQTRFQPSIFVRVVNVDGLQLLYDAQQAVTAFVGVSMAANAATRPPGLPKTIFPNRTNSISVNKLFIWLEVNY